MARLYPNLNEPWSDVDDEGVGFEAEEPSSTFCGREREGGALEPSFGGSPNAPAGESTDGVDLSEFEDHFLGRSRSGSHDPPVLQRLRKRWQNQRFPSSHAASNASPSIFEPVEGTRTAKSVSSVASWSWGVGEGAVRWAMVASLWKKVLLTVLLGLACSMLVSTLRAQRDTHRLDNYLPCPSQTQHSLPPCIPEAELKVAKVVALKVADILHERAAHYICGTKDVPSLTVSLEELKRVHSLKDVSREEMKLVFHLILVNPHWNIRWMDKDNKTVTDWTHYPHSSDLLASSSPSLPLNCHLLLRLANLWRLLQWMVLVVVGAVVVYAVFALYRRRKRRQEFAVFSLVGRIMEVMKYHYKKSCSKKDLLPYLAIIHVRDMLIPPSERKAKEQLWREAVDWVASHESRVRVETRRIAGQDFEVWRWIQEDPPPTEVHSSQPSSGGRVPSKGNWHGSVFDHYPPEITTKVAPPTGTPSVCIRLKNMFEPIRKMGESQILELENAVLERCHPHGAVVHVWVDKKSPVGCVYLKMDSLKSAMDSYNALHGGWYKGKLVTAKYIPEVKYHKWFPVALNAKTPILQS